MFLLHMFFFFLFGGESLPPAGTRTALTQVRENVGATAGVPSVRPRDGVIGGEVLLLSVEPSFEAPAEDVVDETDDSVASVRDEEDIFGADLFVVV